MRSKEPEKPTANPVPPHPCKRINSLRKEKNNYDVILQVSLLSPLINRDEKVITKSSQSKDRKKKNKCGFGFKPCFYCTQSCSEVPYIKTRKLIQTIVYRMAPIESVLLVNEVGKGAAGFGPLGS